MGISQSVQADIDGDGQLEDVQGSDNAANTSTTVTKAGNVIWTQAGFIDGWNRRPWDIWTVLDVDGDGSQEIVLANNRDGYVGVMKWGAGAMHVPWATPPPLTGPGPVHWMRNSDDTFDVTSFNGVPAIKIDHASTGWHGVLAWENNGLSVVKLWQDQVKVPALVGLRLDKAGTELASVGLAEGMVYNPTNVILASQLWVQTQSPIAGAMVPLNSKVDLTVNVQTQPPVAFSALTLLNSNTDGRTVTIWLYSNSTGLWTKQGDVSLGATLTVTLPDGVACTVAAVDTGLVNCSGNDASDVNCRRWAADYIGSKSAGITSATLT